MRGGCGGDGLLLQFRWLINGGSTRVSQGRTRPHASAAVKKLAQVSREDGAEREQTGYIPGARATDGWHARNGPEPRVARSELYLQTHRV